MCLYPKIILNRKYLPNKKNGGKPPPLLDERTKYVPIGCQQCVECRKQKSREWQVRLLEDIKTHTNGKFITFTFSNESIKKISENIETLEGYERDNEIATWAMRHFLERWRKKYKKSLRHWTVTELGHNGTENIHLHGIIWTDEPLSEVERIWSYGYIWKGKKENGRLINYVSPRTVNYIIKYVNKIDHKHKSFKSKVLTSPGIGHNYTNTFNSSRNKYNGTKTRETYTSETGHLIALPIYYRNKIYTEKEREQLWLHKLDRQERWICGEKIDISVTETYYYKLLKFHQERNKQLGYGDGEKDWTRIVYERERRNLMHYSRINNIKNQPRGAAP